MKYLLVLAVILVAFWIWRNNRLTDDAEASRESIRKKRAPKRPAIMVACLHCGTHLPESEAVRGRQGAYCSAEHRQLSESSES
ncbi:MAG: PP0621 family protein [Hydrogenophaga sp.]|uniref:PP0621 family protein n=1 Tax=Hydrogenophaga sp. TaxID=1904254 RepID=UPI0027215963|nr:PP0621 family protein [Hydrogenophaga sp.]MDO9146400.1 PP0621 family protein [Hydrogenophaga sp.]MDO9605887.1 PP0621 family protein [Hydrogenophaga sp.]MDP2163094.1 PP0621 family protein [Hydrogenophaga sp.]MDP3476447.1 PP0621 family protein [Hydrogenophaga sp.]